MYSGTTFRNKSGQLIGAHQKIDRVARRQLKPVLPAGVNFPTIRQILHFEGNNGPDGIKRKSPGKDELWHFIDPANPKKGQMLAIIDDHLENLAEALCQDNQERAAFEAAWLAHAIVDGLTPAHHYPLEEKLELLRGESMDTRVGVKQKLMVSGKSRRELVKNNWQLWGSKGVMTTHFLFELGVATTIAGLKMSYARPTADQLIRVEDNGLEPIFLDSLVRVHHLKMYEKFHKTGWTRILARDTRSQLAPTIVRTVTLSWYLAAIKAAKKRGLA